MQAAQTHKQKLIWIPFIAYLAFLIFVTLFTHNYYTYGRSSNFVIFSSIRLMLRSGSSVLIVKNIFGNVLLFLPLGFLMSTIIPSKRRFGWQILFAFSISTLIEACQYFFAARIFDIDDILLNTAGSVLGFVIFLLLRFIKRKCVVLYVNGHR
ncbi:VanZ family protein [Sporolactobacillus inulinus]|uniref:ABC transporter permease n=1 Tax=Sporolactobacillus inulinus CASD TaxID=1069536 RepID=A0A0U1QQ85_9BACL|nr:VanZ family protein [Sporolactobacillus inulinus]KLI02796.1 ABC transporter permease [Sporolactobacillus inulinus CASD]GEB77156.1 hypothetical protein SIN01_15010 [Sporolactobacillus inulinus]